MLAYATRYAARARHVLVPLALAVTGAIASAKSVQALTFNFNAPSSIDVQAYNGFVAAGNLWSSIFTDNVTINIDIGFRSLDRGVLAQAGSASHTVSYSEFKSALMGDRTSLDDILAASNLQNGSSFNMLINRTSNSPNGYVSPTPYLDNDNDANNSTIRLSTANAKALGLLGANDLGLDAEITFSSDFAFDFDQSNGITSGAFDFIGIAAHEIGHALGFLSGVDVLDYNAPDGFDDDNFIHVSPLDMFRYSSASHAFGKGVIDWTADTRDKYFSLDGGDTMIGDMTPISQGFSTGVNFGDRNQASHWKDNLGRGIMDPTAARGELLRITELDKRGFDAIGWNRRDANAIPTPAMLPSLIGLGLGFLRKRQQAKKLSSGSAELQ